MKLKPCPFCGEEPELSDGPGSCIDIDCCVSMSVQKCDVLTREEQDTWDDKKYVYSEKAEGKALKYIVDQWNERVGV